MTSHFVRIPPDSTGKKIAMVSRTELYFDTLQVGEMFQVNDIIIGATSSAQGTITGLEVDQDAGTGQLFLKEVTGTFQNNEQLEVNSVYHANVNTTLGTIEDVHSQSFVLADPENPNFKQRIDAVGAQLTSFSDGDPLFSPFGDMLVAEQTPIQDYKQAYDELPHLFFDDVSGTGSVTYSAVDAGTIIDTGGGLLGAKANRTSHMYHPYQPGTGNLIEMTVGLGDSGKTGNRRRWGYFDGDNGVFFELDGTDLYIVQRYEGVDTRVIQADWNKNKLDGSSNRPFNLDLTKVNIFWIDFQWLGAGRVRAGVSTQTGEKRVAHQFENANANPAVYMRTATLPVRFENENTGAASGNSQLKQVCTAVKSLGYNRRLETHFNETYSSPKAIADTDGEVPIYSIRPQTTFKTLRNSSIGILDDLSISSSNNLQYIIRVRRDTSLTGASFSNTNVRSASEVDTSATLATGGEVVWSRFANGGQSSHFTLSDEKEKSDLEELFRYMLEADNTTQQTLTVTIETIETGSSNYRFMAEWVEFQL